MSHPWQTSLIDDGTLSHWVHEASEACHCEALCSQSDSVGTVITWKSTGANCRWHNSVLHFWQPSIIPQYSSYLCPHVINSLEYRLNLALHSNKQNMAKGMTGCHDLLLSWQKTVTFIWLALCSFPLTLRKAAAIVWVASWRGSNDKELEEASLWAIGSQGTKTCSSKDSKWLNFAKNHVSHLESRHLPGRALTWLEVLADTFNTIRGLRFLTYGNYEVKNAVALRLLFSPGLICYTARDS